MKEVVVTRHSALVALLRERGIVGEDVDVLSHVSDPSQVKGARVIGILPFHLAAAAEEVVVVPLELSLEDREQMQKGDLSLERLRQIAGAVTTYVVRQR